ncbi:uncharacterized protein LOC142931579 isoform X3 [Anarhichas minor]|uniref:uncharacterized protein LOC142931579 isoform X3 n=1 Tax=Anarhichas minor TaxID=65739 RepID=UPI003F73FBCA
MCLVCLTTSCWVLGCVGDAAATCPGCLGGQCGPRPQQSQGGAGVANADITPAALMLTCKSISNTFEERLLELYRQPLRFTDVQQLLVVKEEVPPEQQEWSSSLDQEDPEPPHIKEDQEELWTSQDGEQLQGLEEADIIKFTFTPVKSEDDEEEAQSSQLHQRQTEQMETEADGEDCGGPEPGRNADPDNHPEPDNVQKLLVVKEEVPSEQQEWSSSLDQEDPEPPHIKEDQEDPEPPHIKEEQEELWTSQEGEQLQGLEEADITKFTFTHVKNEDDEEEAQSSQLHQRRTEQMETEADGEDCEEPEPDRDSDPDRHPESETVDKTGDSSEPETDNSDDWNETREPQSGLNSLNNGEVSVSDSRWRAGEKPFSCTECDRRFRTKGGMKRHMMTHTGEKPFSCSVCRKSFAQSADLEIHMRIHTGEKRLRCRVCDQRFSWLYQLRNHECVGQQAGVNALNNGDVSVRDSTCSAGEKLFSCSTCEKTFGSSGHLKRHENSHKRETIQLPFVKKQKRSVRC